MGNLVKDLMEVIGEVKVGDHIILQESGLYYGGFVAEKSKIINEGTGEVYYTLFLVGIDDKDDRSIGISTYGHEYDVIHWTGDEDKDEDESVDENADENTDEDAGTRFHKTLTIFDRLGLDEDKLTAIDVLCHAVREWDSYDRYYKESIVEIFLALMNKKDVVAILDILADNRLDVLSVQPIVSKFITAGEPSHPLEKIMDAVEHLAYPPIELPEDEKER